MLDARCTLSVFGAILTVCALPHPSIAGIIAGGQLNDSQTSVGYDTITGEVFVDAPDGLQLTSVRIASTANIFTGSPAQHLSLPPVGFDVDDDGVVFKAVFGSSFGSLSFGNVAQPGLAEAFVLEDLDVTGSVEGGGGLGPVDLVFAVPEPTACATALLGVLVAVMGTRRTSAIRRT